MSRPRAALLAVWLAIALAALALAGPAGASAAGQIVDVKVENQFPSQVVFKATVTTDADLDRIELHYTILPDGTDAIGAAQFSPGRTATAEFNLGTNDGTTYIPAGTTIRYHWEATDTAGATVTSEEQQFQYLDNRFEWTPIVEGNLTLYYHSGSDEYARGLAGAGNDGLNRTGDLLGVTVPYPVHVFLYGSPDEMVPALMRRSQRFSELVTTGGVRVSSDTVFVAKGFEDNEDTLRHELGHVVTRVAGIGAFGDLPAWLDEGVAVYSQRSPGSGYEGAIEDAISSGDVLSIRSIVAEPDDPTKVNVFYGEAWSLVKYLVDTYGQAKFATLFAEFKKGSTVDDALTAAYGFDALGLENAWRSANGLPEVQAATGTPTATTSETPAATRTPFTAGTAGTDTATATQSTTPGASPTPAGQDDSDGSPALLFVLIAGALIVLGLGLGIGVAVRRRQ